MTYTINQAVDVNDTVDIGNIQVSTNTISSTNTNGNITFSPNGTGNIGVGTSSPFSGSNLLGMHISKSYHSALALGEPTNSTYGGVIQTSDQRHRVFIGANIYDDPTDSWTSTTANKGYAAISCLADANDWGTTIQFWASDTNHTSGASLQVRMAIDGDGLVGIGTTDPKARLHVTSANSGVTLNSGSRRYFKHNTALSSDTGTWAFNDVSVYGTGDIITNGYVLSHAATTFSDARIKNSVIDIDDDSALNTLRLIKPKRYNYTDTVLKGSEPVWGFIAQEVSSVLDYAVTNITKEIPNIYKQANVSEGNILTIDGFDTSSLSNDSEGNLVTKLMLKTSTNKDIEVTIDTILSSNSIRLTEALEEEDINGTVDNEPFTNEIFVYGQIVDDFRTLKKDAIFTVAVAALQEIDRRQTDDNERIVELESEVETLKAQVAALLQHTGVTV